MKERDLAETTAERYEGILRNYIEPYLGRRALSEIKEPAIRQWRKTLQDVGVGAATIGRRTGWCTPCSTRRLTTCSSAGARAGSKALDRTRRMNDRR